MRIPSTLRRLDLRQLPGRSTEAFLDRRSDGVREIAADRDEAELRILVPVPVRTEQRETVETGLACD